MDREIFKWHEIDKENYNANDWIKIYNITNLLNHHLGVELNAVKVNGNIAEFESAIEVDSTFTIKKGDLFFVNYWNSSEYLPNNEVDPRKIITYYVGTEENSPQYIVDNPSESMSYMQGNLKMYDIVTAVEDNKIPDIHFKHLSAILRITLHNETGKDLYPTKLEFEYPGVEAFFNTTLYCSIDDTASDGSGLKVYTDSSFFTNDSKAYTDHVGTTINGKEGAQDSGNPILSGQTYDLYISTVPRIANTLKGDRFIIKLITDHETGEKQVYSITLDNFNVAIEAGKRYWFNLTAVEENGVRKLVLTK